MVNFIPWKTEILRKLDQENSWNAYAAAIIHSTLFLRPSGVTAAKALLAMCLKSVAVGLGTGVKEGKEADNG